MGGTPVLASPRVPMQNLVDALEGGESMEDFLEGFPIVTPRRPSPSLKPAS